MISLEFLLASAIGLLVATGIYLILRARTFPVVLGLAVLGYAVNLFLFAMGRLQVSSPAIPNRNHQYYRSTSTSTCFNSNRDRFCHYRFYCAARIT